LEKQKEQMASKLANFEIKVVGKKEYQTPKKKHSFVRRCPNAPFKRMRGQRLRFGQELILDENICRKLFATIQEEEDFKRTK